MKLPALLFLCLGPLLAAPALGMYRCEGPHGTVSFQDQRCPEGAREQALQAQPQPPMVSGAADDAARARQVQRNQEASSQALRKTQLQRELPEAEAALASHRAACDQKLAALRARRDGISPRFPGQQSAAQDSLADTQSRCDREGGTLANRLETLRAECASLACTSGGGETPKRTETAH